MARKFLNGVDLAGQRVQNVADGTAATDAVTKQQLDNAVAGLAWKSRPVRAATTVAGTLASSFENGDVIDGVTLVTGDRILVKDQAAGAENGIYTVNASGAPTRASDADSSAELVNATVVVSEGTVNADKAFTQTTNAPITVGTTALVWGPVGGGTSYTADGQGLEVIGNQFSIELDTASGLSKSASGLKIDPSIVTRKYAANVGNGSATSIAVTHNLGTRDVHVQVYDAATFETVEVDVVRTDVNTVTLTFATAPASNAYRAVVQG